MVNKGLGDMDRLISDFSAGVILDGTQSNLEESSQSLLELLSDSETPARCRELAEKHFNMDIGASKYLDLYARILTVSG